MRVGIVHFLCYAVRTNSLYLSPKTPIKTKITASNNGVRKKGKVTVKCTLVQALRLCRGRTAHRGSPGIVLPFHDHGTGKGEGSASRPGRSLPPGKTRYPLYRRLGGPQGRSGQVRKISPPPTGIRPPDRPARRQSLYRLSYQAHECGKTLFIVGFNDSR